MKLFCAIFAGALLLSAPVSSRSQTAQVYSTRLSVDFTNDESRSLSVRLGSGDGITAEMNFAVLDSASREIARFYPYEILSDRFWSGPLKQAQYALVGQGLIVVPVEMTPADAARLRAETRTRVDDLKEERRARRVAGIKERLADIDLDVEDLRVDEYRYEQDLIGEKKRLRREKQDIRDDVGDLEDKIADLKDDRDRLEEDRAELVEKINSYRRRSDPPADRIADLDEDLRDINDDIARLNNEIADRRDEIRVARSSADDIKAGIEEISLDLDQVRNEINRLLAERRDLVQELGRLSR